MFYSLLFAIIFQTPATVIIPASGFLGELPKGNILTNAEAQNVSWLFNNTGIVLNSETNLMTSVLIPEDGNYHLFVRSSGGKGSSFRVAVNDKVSADAFGDTTISWKTGGQFSLKKGKIDIKITRIDPGSV